MRIDQVTSHFGANKSIDQEILIFQDIIRSLGYESNIYSNINQSKNTIKPIHEIWHRNPTQDYVIHHYSCGSNTPEIVMNSGAYTICRLHSLIPSDSIKKHKDLYQAYQFGWKQLPLVLSSSDEIWTTWDKKLLEKISTFLPETHYLPILRDYKKVSIDKQALALSEKIAHEDSFKIFHIGRITPENSLHDNLMNLAQLKQNLSGRFQLLVYGNLNKHYLKSIESMITKLDLNYTNISNFAPNKDIIFIDQNYAGLMELALDQSDVLSVVNDNNEYLDLMVYASLLKKPIILNKDFMSANHKDLTDIIIDKTDPVEFVKTIMKLRNRDYYTKMSENSFKKFKNFEIKNSSKRFVNRLLASIHRKNYESNSLWNVGHMNVEAS